MSFVFLPDILLAIVDKTDSDTIAGYVETDQ